MVKVQDVTKSSDKGHIFGPHLVEVRDVTKSSNEGHIFLDHIWFQDVAKSSNEGHIFWTTFGQSPRRDKVLQRGHIFGPHLVEVRDVTKSSNEGHIFLDHFRLKSKT